MLPERVLSFSRVFIFPCPDCEEAGRECASLFPSLNGNKKCCDVSLARLYISAARRELFLLQKVPQSSRQFCLEDFPFKRRLNCKEFRPLRRATKGFAFGYHHLLKKVDENFIFTLLRNSPPVPSAAESALCSASGCPAAPRTADPPNRHKSYRSAPESHPAALAPWG